MDWLAEALAARRPFVIGEVTVTFDGDDAVLAGPRSTGEPACLPADPGGLRAYLRISSNGAYRPMSSARGLRPGWTLRAPIDALVPLLDVIYPLAPVHIRMHAAGELRVVPLDEVLARQSGRYEVVAGATAAQQKAVVETLCAQCVRIPAWQGESVPAGTIPCPEACSVLVALCREVVIDPAPAVAASLTPEGEPVAFAAFEDPANPLVTAARRRLAG